MPEEVERFGFFVVCLGRTLATLWGFVVLCGGVGNGGGGGVGNGEDWRVVIDLIVSCLGRGGMIKNVFSRVSAKQQELELGDQGKRQGLKAQI